MTFAVHSGFSSAAVPRLTRRAPVASARSSDASSRMPPESSTWTSRRATTSASRSALEPRPNAASRSTRWIHSAPPDCQSSAAASGSPYEVSEPASPWTRRTAWPSATSTAGSSTRRAVTGFSIGVGRAGGVRVGTPVGARAAGRARSERADPVLEQGRARVPGLLGVELRRGQRAVLDGGDEPAAVLGPRDEGPADGRVRGQVLARGERPGGVGVDEVEALVLVAPEPPGALGAVHGVPAHVRHDVGLEPVDESGPLPEPVGERAVLVALLEHDLHADADAEHGPPAGEAAAHDLVAAHAAQPGHDGRERPHAGHDEAVRVLRAGAVGGQLDVGPHALQRANGGADVAEPVVEDDDGRPPRARGRRRGLLAHAPPFLARRAADVSRRIAFQREIDELATTP